MRGISLEEIKKQLRERDAKTLDSRAKRLKELKELEGITYSVVNRTVAERMDNFIAEAIENYKNGCFRSCIFCCASAVEQAFRHEMIHSSDRPEKVQKFLEKKTFGGVIKAAKDYERLWPFIKDAGQLNELRNEVAVHPLYVAKTYGSFDKMLERADWVKKTIHQDLCVLKKFLCSEQQKELDETLGTLVTFEDIVDWQELSPQNPLQKISLEAYKTMKKIIEGLYPSE